MSLPTTQAVALPAVTDYWTVSAQGAGAQAPSASKAAAAAGVRHYAVAVEFSVSCTGTAQPSVQINLRDGATGAGTILKSWTVSAPTNASTGCAVLYSYTFPVPIPGSAATAMTLEFAAAAAAATISCVNLQGFDA